MSTPKIKLTYFDIEAAAECVRLALTLANVDFEDERIAFPAWKELKPKTPHGKLPVMTIDGGPMRTQSKAMLRYAATLNPASGLYNQEQMFDIDEAIGFLEDLQNSWSPNLYMGMRPEKYGYPEGWSKTEEGVATIKLLREKWVQDELPAFLTAIESMIEKNGGKWLVSGDKPTIADCVAVPLLRSFTKGHIDHVDTGCIEAKSTAVADYVKRFCALSEIKGRYDKGLGSE